MTEKLVLKGDNCGSGFTPSMALILPTDMAALSFASIHYPHPSPSMQAACHHRGSATSRTRWPVAMGPHGPMLLAMVASFQRGLQPPGKHRESQTTQTVPRVCASWLHLLSSRHKSIPGWFFAIGVEHEFWMEWLKMGKDFGFRQKVAFVSFLRKCFQQTWICKILSESCCQHPRLLKTFIFTSGQFDMTFMSGQATAQHVIVNTKLPPTALHPPPWKCSFLQCSVFSYRAICG